MNRALRAATVGVLLLTPVALTACGAGQVAQTSSQVRDKTGPSAQIGDLSLRQVLIDYPDTGTYAKGDSAQLRLSITNSGPDDDALVGISGDGFDGVSVANPATPTGTATGASGSSAAASSASQTAGNSVGGGASSKTAASGSSTAAASATTSSAAASAGSSNSVNIPIPAHTGVFIGDTDAPSVFLTGLHQSLGPAQHLRLTFTFQKAGQVTLDVTVSGPDQEKARSSTYDFSEQPSATPGENG